MKKRFKEANSGAWIFVFLSHRDLDKVRHIPNELERRRHHPRLFFLKCLEADNVRPPEREEIGPCLTENRTGQSRLPSVHTAAMRATRRSRVRNCTSMPLYFRVKAGRASEVVTSNVALG